MKITIDRKVLLGVSAGLIVFILSGALLGRVAAVEGTYSSLKVFNEALYLVLNNYVQPIEPETLMEGSYRGLLESLDPGNEYLNADEYRIASRGEPAGTADVGLNLSKRRGYIAVVSTLAGSPADEAGLHSGDLLIRIDGTASRHMGVWETGQALGGKPGSRVTVTVNPAGGTERRTIELVRRRLAPAEPSGIIMETDVGVIAIAGIRNGDARRMDRAIASLRAQGAERLLLDLRGCSSDNLAEAIGMVSLFVADGTVVTVADRYDGDKAYRVDGRRLAWEGVSLAILVDQGTENTCELLAAALRDHLDAPVVGERTWGNAAVHALLPLRDGDGVILAIGRYLSPSGKDWNDNGLEPDYEIVAADEEEVEGDDQRRRAVEYLKGMALKTPGEAA